MKALTLALADGLPPLGKLVADEPVWRHPSGVPGREGVAHLRIWTTASVPPGHLAVAFTMDVYTEVAEELADAAAAAIAAFIPRRARNVPNGELDDH
jgi:hypothetical protein